MEKHQRFPLNVAGDFYVVDGMCMACTAPTLEAPDLMAHAPNGLHCYFKRQPTTPEEINQATLAVCVSCCGGVRYAGTDLKMIRLLTELGVPESCDQYLTGATVSEPAEPHEPPTSFKWVILAAVVIWTLGAAMIFLKWY